MYQITEGSAIFYNAFDGAKEYYAKASEITDPDMKDVAFKIATRLHNTVTELYPQIEESSSHYRDALDWYRQIAKDNLTS